MNGPLQLSEINENGVINFYKFSYRKNYHNKKVYKVNYAITMNKLDINDYVFDVYNEIIDYANAVNTNENNIVTNDITKIKEEFGKFLTSGYSAFELILPRTVGTNYNQSDIDSIYYAITEMIPADNNIDAIPTIAPSTIVLNGVHANETLLSTTENAQVAIVEHDDVNNTIIGPREVSGRDII